jgi:hypothetical protein
VTLTSTSIPASTGGGEFALEDGGGIVESVRRGISFWCSCHGGLKLKRVQVDGEEKKAENA